MSARALHIYRRVYVESAAPAQILVELLSRLCVDCETAARAIGQKDVRAKSEAINHALAIVGELEAALDPSVAADFCANMTRLYDSMRRRLVQGSLDLAAKPVSEVGQLAAGLRDAFREAQEIVRS